MTQRVRGARARRRQSVRRLQAELLEERLALSSQSALAAPFPDGLNHPDPAVRALIANVTTSAPADVLFSAIDPTWIAPAEGSTPHASLVEASDLIGLPAFRNDPRFAGIDGSGYSVVIIDSGMDLDHPFFGPDADGNGVADRIVFSADFTSIAGTGQDGNGHGTHVSSIVASQDGTYSGVAPGVNIINLRVFGADNTGTTDDLEEALQWVVANAAAYNVVSVNMSLGYGDNHAAPTTRPELGLSDELAAIAAQDVIVVSASGNDFFDYQHPPGVAYPAADPSSLSIGAVWDADVGGPHVWQSGSTDFTTGPNRVVSFSQRHPTLSTVFAPGGGITAAAIGGGIATLSGTSMATPFVSGMVALAQQIAVEMTGERLSLSEIASLLKQTGIPIFDGDDEDDNVDNTQQEFRRLDVVAMANAILSGGLSDLSIPSGISLESASVPSGGQARLDVTLVNQGASASGQFTGRFYLSDDAVIDSSDLLLSGFTEQLAAGQSLALKGHTVPLPADLTPGSYFLGVVLDEAGEVAEGNEENNVAVVPLEVAAAGAEMALVDVATGASLVDGSALLAFGSVSEGGANVVRTLRILNDGSATLELSSLALPPGYVAVSFPASVAPLSSVEFTIQLDASNPAGAYAGVASLNSNDLDESLFGISLSGAITEADDHGNSAASATHVVAPSNTPGSIFPAGDVDWFQFAAAAGATYEFEVALNSLNDSLLRLIDRNGVTELAVDDNGGAGGGSRIVWTAPADGDYFLEVRGKVLLQGSYHVEISAEDDHGNQASAATPTSDPSTNPGVIETPGDEDWFSFAASASVQYQFDATTASAASFILTVIDVDGTTVLEVSGGNLSMIEWTAPKDGAYYVTVQGEPPGTIGGFELSILGGDDHGDNAANATLAALPATVGGEIETPLDVDWFAFAAIEGARYEFATTLATLNDSRLRLIDQDGVTVLDVDDDDGAGLASFIEWTAPAAGLYYVEVSGFELRTGTYDLAISVVDDHGDDAATATPATDPASYAGILELAADVDWFSFQAIAGVEYRFEAELGVLSSAVLRLIGTDGQTSLATNGGAAGVPPVIVWTAPADGQFFLEVSTTAGSELGDYLLILTGEDDHGGSAPQATPLAIPLGTDGMIERVGDADWFSLPTVPDLEYRITVDLGTLPGARVRVLAPDGVTEVASTAGGAGAPVVVAWTATMRATYFIEVIGVSVDSTPPGEEPETPPEGSILEPGDATGSYRVTPSAVSAIPGDFDGDSDVDGVDFLVWQRTHGTVYAAVPTPLDAQGFEGLSYAPGSLHNQNGWTRLGPAAGTAVVQSSVAASGFQAVQVDRAKNIDNWWGVPLGDDAAEGPLVVVQWDMRVTAAVAEDESLGPFFGVQAYDDEGGFGLLGSLGVDATSLDVVYQREVDGIIVETGQKVTADVWYAFALSLDFGADRFTAYFEGRALASGDFVDLGVAGSDLDRLTDADIAALASQLETPSQQATGTAYFDNFRILDGVPNEEFPADGNGDGAVDALDLDLWRSNYGVDYAPPPVGGALAAAFALDSTADSTPQGFAVARAPIGRPVYDSLGLDQRAAHALAPLALPVSHSRTLLHSQASTRNIAARTRGADFAAKAIDRAHVALAPTVSPVEVLRGGLGLEIEFGRRVSDDLGADDDASCVGAEVDAALTDLFG